MKLKPCNETLPEMYMTEQNRNLINKLLCLDPQEAEIFGFSDYADGGTSMRLEIEIQLCYMHYTDEVACESEEDIDKYFQDTILELNWYATQTKVDYSREEDYIDHSIAWIARDDIKPNQI